MNNQDTPAAPGNRTLEKLFTIAGIWTPLPVLVVADHFSKAHEVLKAIFVVDPWIAFVVMAIACCYQTVRVWRGTSFVLRSTDSTPRKLTTERRRSANAWMWLCAVVAAASTVVGFAALLLGLTNVAETMALCVLSTIAAYWLFGRLRPGLARGIDRAWHDELPRAYRIGNLKGPQMQTADDLLAEHRINTALLAKSHVLSLVLVVAGTVAAMFVDKPAVKFVLFFGGVGLGYPKVSEWLVFVAARRTRPF